jgi:hypothetical protein
MRWSRTVASEDEDDSVEDNDNEQPRSPDMVLCFDANSASDYQSLEV